MIERNSNPRRNPCSTRSRPPAFTPVKLRARKDGWCAKVQCAFLAQLYVTGSVAAAAKAVGRSRASAYKLRERRGAESFARSWDKVLTGPAKRGQPAARAPRAPDWRKLTHEELFWRCKMGLWRPVIYRGRMRNIARKPDNSALLRLLARLDVGRRDAVIGTRASLRKPLLNPSFDVPEETPDKVTEGMELPRHFSDCADELVDVVHGEPGDVYAA